MNRGILFLVSVLALLLGRLLYLGIVSEPPAVKGVEDDAASPRVEAADTTAGHARPAPEARRPSRGGDGAAPGANAVAFEPRGGSEARDRRTASPRRAGSRSRPDDIDFDAGPPAWAPPPHLTDPTYDDVFDSPGARAENLLSERVIIEAMVRDGLPAEHIAFMREALAVERDVTLFEHPPRAPAPAPPLSPAAEERNVITMYEAAGASPQVIDEMVDAFWQEYDRARNRQIFGDSYEEPPTPDELAK